MVMALNQSGRFTQPLGPVPNQAGQMCVTRIGSRSGAESGGEDVRDVQEQCRIRGAAPRIGAETWGKDESNV